MSSRFILFTLIGGSGIFVHLAVVALLHRFLAVNFAAAQIAGTFVAMTSNFYLNNRLTYRDMPLKGTRLVAGLSTFYLVCGAGAVANVFAAQFLFDNGLNWMLASLAGVAVSAVWNFASSSALVWRKRSGGGT